MDKWRVYGKKLQNNPGNETSIVAEYPAMTRSEAISMAICDYGNNGIYDASTYFAVKVE